MLNKRTMNNNSRCQHEQLVHCSWYYEHIDSILPTPILFVATDRTQSLLQSGYNMSTVCYTRYTRITHCRPCCNLFLLQRVRIAHSADVIATAFLSVCPSRSGVLSRGHRRSQHQARGGNWRCLLLLLRM